MTRKSVTLLLCTAILCAVSAGAWAVPPGLVGWWSFDEGTGTVAGDGSGNGNDGEVIDATWTAGQLGSALEFNGSAYVDVPPACFADISEEVTIAFWINIPAANLVQSNFIMAAFSDPANNEARVLSMHLPWAGGTVYFDTSGPGYDRTNKAVAADELVDAWSHWAFVKNATTGDVWIYRNGELWHSATGLTKPLQGADVTKFTIGTKASLAEGWFTGMIDDVQLYNVALTQQQVRDTMEGITLVAAASPNPASGAVDVLRDEAVMSWTAGQFADTHTVYLSTSIDAVANGDADALAAEGLADASYDPGRLEFGTQYFWRVDEVNAAPDNTVFPGEVWNFTVEPKSLAIAVGSVQAEASSTATGQDPNNTVNGSGLNENDEHSNLQEDMWLGADTDVNPSIQFSFEEAMKLDKVHVWNHNTQTESILGFGIKEALIEYSVDGENWTEFGTVELAQADGSDTYDGADVSLDGIIAQYVKITGLSNFSILGLPQKGLSEVRFYYIPNQARELSPADGTITDTATVTLSWRPGREAAQHEVYLGTDAENLELAGTTSENSFVADTLDYSTTYHWQVTEVNEAETPARYEGEVISFTTPNYAVIDDMEIYKAEEGLFIWEHWVDGFENPDENGAVVGNGDEAEMDIVHSGSQSLPMQYNNGAAPISEATLQIDNQDWLAGGIQTLSLYFHGTAGNTGQLYVKINDAQVDYPGAAADLTESPWRVWNIDLAAVGGDLTNVTSLTVGVSGGGATGKLYIDDIRLYPLPGETITPVEPDAASLVAHYTFDGDFSDSAGNSDGTAMGDAKIVTDPTRGQVLSLDGDDDAVSIPLIAEANEVTISMWVNALDAITPSDWKSFFHGVWSEGGIHWRQELNRIDGGVNGVVPGGDLTGAGVVPYEQWSFVVVTLSPTEFSYWLNGIHDISRQLESAPTYQIGDGLIGGYLNGELIEREWAGTIDDVRFYNRVLSEGEILWLSGKTDPVDKPL